MREEGGEGRQTENGVGMLCPSAAVLFCAPFRSLNGVPSQKIKLFPRKFEAKRIFGGFDPHQFTHLGLLNVNSGLAFIHALTTPNRLLICHLKTTDALLRQIFTCSLGNCFAFGSPFYIQFTSIHGARHITATSNFVSN